MASRLATASRSTASGMRAATVDSSAPARTGSISTAHTTAPASNRARVSDPKPGPTSRTTSPGRTPASRTIRRTVPASWTKFCPSVFVGRIPSVEASSRMWLAPSKADVVFVKCGWFRSASKGPDQYQPVLWEWPQAPQGVP